MLEFFSTNEDLLLWYFNDRAIEVFEEQAVLFEHALLNLHDLDEVHVALNAILVSNLSPL